MATRSLTSLRFPKVGPHQPLLCECVIQVFLGGIVLVGWSPIVFTNKLKKPCPLVLPHSCEPLRGYHHLVAVRVAGQALQEVTRSWVVDLTKVVAVWAADVALLTLRGPGTTGHHVTLVHWLFHSCIVLNTVQLTLCGPWGATTGDWPTTNSFMRSSE